MSSRVEASQLTVLGRGMYPLSDIARYSKLHVQRVRSWFLQRSGIGATPIFRSDFANAGGVHSASFLDLVDAFVAGQLRDEGVSMPMVRAAYEALSADLSTDHPFAHSDIYTDGKRVFIHAAKEIGDATLSEALSRQQFFQHIRRLLTHIDYSETTSMAQRWHISKGVVIDPSISFGRPVVNGTGVTTYVVAASHRANGRNSALVADLFGITQPAVELAVDFEDEYGRLNAA